MKLLINLLLNLRYNCLIAFNRFICVSKALIFVKRSLFVSIHIFSFCKANKISLCRQANIFKIGAMISFTMYCGVCLTIVYNRVLSTTKDKYNDAKMYFDN